MRKKKGKKGIAIFMAAIMLAGCMFSALPAAEVHAASETAVANKTWDEVEAVLKTKLGTGYETIGKCTGFLYWALDNAYGKDWGDNSTVSGLEDKLQEKGITKVAEGSSGSIPSNMKPGDIIIFLENGSGSHCAILGEGGKMYHASTSDGVKYGPTLSEWMAYPDAAKNCDSYRIYRGPQSTGSLSIIKSSENPDMTDGNSCYSLAGAKYGLYQDGTLIGTLTTDADGKASLADIPYGSYTLKEISASKGYALDVSSYKITIDSKTTTQKVTEKPQGDPTSAIIYKLDADTHESWSAGNLPQGSASLEDAEYTVKYYDGYYTNATDFTKLTATRSWVIRTNENVKTLLTKDLLVEGDDFYYSSNGAVTLPLGTVTIQETKAPEGYVLDKTLHVRQVTQEGKIESVSTYNIPLHKESVKRGGVEIRKNDMQTGKSSQGDATFKDTEFSIINKSHNAVSVDGKTFAPGEVVKVITTGEDGIAKTSADCLPFGEYTIVETKAPEGYLNEGILEKDFSIRLDGEMVDLTEDAITNDVIRGGVQIEKWDRELGKSEAVGGADYSTAEAGAKLTGIQFTITNRSKASVIAGGKEYAPGDVITTLKTAWNEEKKAYTVETPSDFLPYGTYEIKETKTNKSYVLTDGKARTFEIRENGKIVTAGKDGTDLIFKNFVVRGDIEFVKVEDSTMKRMAGIPFKLTNTVTGESHVLVTDDNGYASTAASWNKHTANTNINDKLLDAESIKPSDVDMESGVWFGLAEFGSMAEANDTLGALPYGTYTLDEMRCENNAGHDLIENVTIKVSRNNVTVDLGTITNDLTDTTVPEEPDEPDSPDQPVNPDVPKQDNAKQTESKSSSTPKTGDGFKLFPLIGIMAVAFVSGLIAAYKRKEDIKILNWLHRSWREQEKETSVIRKTDASVLP